MPTVFVNCYTQEVAQPSLIPNEVEAGKDAAKHVISLGHERIGTITGEMWMEASAHRLAGLKATLEENGLELPTSHIFYGNWHTSSGYDGARQLLSRLGQLTAIICQNDWMALGVYLFAKENGIRIPEDLTVVGNDDEEFCRHVNPNMSSISMPQREMGRLAAEALLSGNLPSPRTMVPCPLVLRSSSAAPSLRKTKIS
jgi:LacI family transcriptional regulator